MFELFRVYELAKNETNKLFRFFCIKYVKHELKHKFFDRYKKSIEEERIKLNPDLLNEFIQFYNCLDKQYYVKRNREVTYVTGVIRNNKGLEVNNKEYSIRVMITSDNDIEVVLSADKYLSGDITFILDGLSDDRYESVYSKITNEVVLRAMYNYCVSYVYGKDSKLYME